MNKNITDDFEAFRRLGQQVESFLDAEQDSEELIDDEAKGWQLMDSLDESRYHFSDLEYLVRGGEKVISRVYDSRTDRYVAIAQPRRRKHPRDFEAFIRGARLAAKLQHPNILPIYEIGRDRDGAPYFVTQQLKGADLGEIISAMPADVDSNPVAKNLDDLLNIYLKVCEAVIYAHSRGVLHLDIKPANIMVGQYGQVTLIDWGLARVMNENIGQIDSDIELKIPDADTLNNIVHSGTVRGTPGFVSPEQIAGKKSGRQADVYSLGAVLYSILTNSLPVEGKSNREIYTNTRKGLVIPPSDRKSNALIPASLEAITLKALSTKTSNRYQNVQEIYDDISLYRQGFASLAEKPSVWKLMQLLVQRHSQILFLAAIFVGVITTVSIVSLKKVLTQRAQTIQNLELYQKEVQLSEELRDDLSRFFETSIIRRDLKNSDLVSEFIDAKANAPSSGSFDQRSIYQMKSYLHFADQEFNAAQAAWEQGKEQGKPLTGKYYKQCVLFGKLKNDSELLSFDQLAQLLRSPVRGKLLSYCYKNHFSRIDKIDPVGYLPLAITVLNIHHRTNSWGDSIRLETRRSGGFHLDLSKAPYPSLFVGNKGIAGKILIPLQLTSLDLSDSQIQDFEDLQFPENFEELILLNVSFPKPELVAAELGNLSMQRLIITRGTIPKKALERYLSLIEVIELEPGEKWPIAK